jgi:hypothetical protein
MRRVPEMEGRRGGGGGERRGRERDGRMIGVGWGLSVSVRAGCVTTGTVIGVYVASTQHGSTDPTSLTTLRKSVSPPPVGEGGIQGDGRGGGTPEDSETLGPLRALALTPSSLPCVTLHAHV